MSLAKLLGLVGVGRRRSAADEDLFDDEPTHVAPALPAGVNHAAKPRPIHKPVVAVPQTTTGFDPYNSGVFNRARAWERTSKR